MAYGTFTPTWESIRTEILKKRNELVAIGNHLARARNTFKGLKAANDALHQAEIESRGTPWENLVLNARSKVDDASYGTNELYRKLLVDEARVQREIQALERQGVGAKR